MFTTLLKLRKESKEFDNNGLFKQANRSDFRMDKIANFLLNSHKYNLPEYLCKKLALSKWLSEKYIKKISQNQWDIDLDDPDNGMGLVDDYEDDDYSIDIEDDTNVKNENIDRPKDYKQTIKTALWDYGKEYDKRFALDLTSAPIEVKGNLATDAVNTNPEGVIIYLIAHPEYQNDKKYSKFMNSVKGDFSVVSQSQALDILKFYEYPQNRAMFPGMCLDLFAQLLQKANGKNVEDPIINKFSPKLARIELYGSDPEERKNKNRGDVDEITDDAESAGRMAPMYEYILKQEGSSASAARSSLEGYYIRHSDRIEDAIASGEFYNVAGAMIGTMLSTVSHDKKNEDKKKRRFPYVSDIDRKLVGGDIYGGVLANALIDMYGEFGRSLDPNKGISREVAQKAYETWDFSSLINSPFASRGDVPSVANKFIANDKQNKLIEEVAIEEQKKKNNGEDYIRFFTDNPIELIKKEIGSLGMILRFQEYSIKLDEAEKYKKALKSFRKKLDTNEKSREKARKKIQKGEDFGKLKLEDTKEEEDIIQRYSGEYHTIIIDPRTGALSLKPDTAAIIEDHSQRKKQVIRSVGESLSEKGGKEEMNRESVAYALEIARKYSYSVVEDEHIDTQRGGGGDGEGRSGHEYHADENAVDSLKSLMDSYESEEDEGKRLKTQEIIESLGRSLFRYLASSKRVLPGLLGFSEAFGSGNEHRFNKYLAVVIDMMKRKGNYGEQSSSYSEDDLVDEEWKAKIESNNAGRIIDTIDVNRENNTVSVTFKDSDEIVVIRGDLPKTQDELNSEDINEESKQRKYPRIELVKKSLKWMQKFNNSEEVIDRENIRRFNENEPGAEIKRQFDSPEREVARSVIMDEGFNNWFVSYINGLSGEEKINFQIEFAIKFNSKTKKPIIAQTEKTFKESRLISYLYYVCGMGTIPVSAIIMEGDINSMLGSYSKIVTNFYPKYKSEGSLTSDEDVLSVFSVEKGKGTDEEGSGGKKIYDKGKGLQGRNRRLSISNSDGSFDMDNVVYLASEYFEHANTTKESLSRMNYSPRRQKSYYLMRIKHMMDMFRLQTVGREVIESILSSVGRTGNTVFNAAAATGEDAVQVSRYKGRIDNKIMKPFRNDLKAKNEDKSYILDEGQPISQRARDALKHLNNWYFGEKGKKVEKKNGKTHIVDVPGMMDNLTLRTDQFSSLKQFESDISDYLSGFSIGGEPIEPLSPENSEELYEKYRQYILERYGQQMDNSYRPQFVTSLSDSYSILSDEEKNPIITRTQRDLTLATDELTDYYRKCAEELNYHIETGSRNLLNNDVSTDDMAEKSNENLEKQLEEKNTSNEPIIDTKAPMEVPPVATPSVEPVMSPAAPKTPFNDPNDSDRRMQEIDKYNKKLWSRMGRIPIDSPDIPIMKNLGFIFDPDIDGFFTVRNPPDYGKYLYKKMRLKNKQANINIDDFIVFGDSEIDYIIDTYVV